MLHECAEHGWQGRREDHRGSDYPGTHEFDVGDSADIIDQSGPETETESQQVDRWFEDTGECR